jgi:hypothetical protein
MESNVSRFCSIDRLSSSQRKVVEKPKVTCGLKVRQISLDTRQVGDSCVMELRSIERSLLVMPEERRRYGRRYGRYNNKKQINQYSAFDESRHNSF